MAKLRVIKYGRTFNLGNFRSERIDIESEVADHEQQDALIIFKEMKAMVELLHKKGQEK